MQHETLGVIFDMDGVIVLSADAHFESWRVTGEQHGVAITRAAFLATFGQVNADCIRTLFGQDTPAHRIESIADQKERAYRDLVRSAVPLAPGVQSLAQRLVDAGARLAVGSSAPRANVDLILDDGGLREFFAVTANGDEVSHGKPAPDVFLLAASRLGIGPSHCVVIEDAPVGIRAARTAGMRAVGVATTHDSAELFAAGAHAVVADLASLDLATLRGSATATDVRR